MTFKSYLAALAGTLVGGFAIGFFGGWFGLSEFTQGAMTGALAASLVAAAHRN